MAVSVARSRVVAAAVAIADMPDEPKLTDSTDPPTPDSDEPEIGEPEADGRYPKPIDDRLCEEPCGNVGSEPHWEMDRHRRPAA